MTWIVTCIERVNGIDLEARQDTLHNKEDAIAVAKGYLNSITKNAENMDIELRIERGNKYDL